MAEVPRLRIVPGKARLSTLLRVAPPRRVIFVLDAGTEEVLVEPGARAAAARSLGVPAEGEASSWEIAWRGRTHLCRVRPLAEIGARTASPHQLVGIEKSRCVPVPKGACVEVEDENGQFLFSFKSPEGFHACGTGEEVCKETVQEVEIETYPERSCRGLPRKAKETLFFCTPA